MALHASSDAAAAKDYPIQSVPFTDVRIADDFWTKRQDVNRTVTIPYCFQQCEETGRIDNFVKAAHRMEGPFVGLLFNDSDVYKSIEAAAYSLATHPDPRLEKHLDDVIAKIAAAQEPDGYLYTTRTVDPAHV
ncbi:MAG: glycoside hydrolase family 127 protein, partial [Candidatus Sumerlaeota bacterium]|nr:glycoside hydrolase family 127 protein [Candidatus Sumerlaeota bacterium]